MFKALALLALSSRECTAATNVDDGRFKRHSRRHLRRGKFTGKTTHRLDNTDLTEDVAFWTRKLQFSIPPAPTPDVQWTISNSPTFVDDDDIEFFSDEPSDPFFCGTAYNHAISEW